MCSGYTVPPESKETELGSSDQEASPSTDKNPGVVLIDSGNFSVRSYLPIIRNDSSTHMYGLAVYVKGELPFPRDLPLQNSADSYLCFRLALLHSVS